MARTKLVAGNWKMNLTQSSGTALVETFLTEVKSRTDVDVLVCPPFTMLDRIHESVKNTHLRVGAQDVHWVESGAFTGRISPAHLVDMGVSHCLVGHSETRGRFGKLEIPESTVGHFNETNETVNLKIRQLLFHAIQPILCVGETLAEREAGQTEAVIAEQLAGALKDVDEAELYFFVVAYEPVWAIGTGQTCPSDEAERICAFIRAWFAEHYSNELAEEVRVLYGGSVKSSNAHELFHKPNIDGGLVGGASLVADEFARIVMAAQSHVG